jgi:hypothetical protein
MVREIVLMMASVPSGIDPLSMILLVDLVLNASMCDLGINVFVHDQLLFE